MSNPIVPPNSAILNAQMTSNAQVPTEGPKVVSVQCDFTVSLAYDLNTLLTQASAQMRSVAGVYINNVNGSGNVAVTVSITNQVVEIGSGKQAFLTLFVPKNATITMSNPDTDNGSVVTFIFTNFPVANCVF